VSDIPEFKPPAIDFPSERQPERPGQQPRKGGNRRRGRSSSRGGRRSPDKSKAKRQAADPSQGGSDAGRALGESLQAAVLRHTTQAVLSRGRGYAKRKRVSDLRIGAGRVRARVLGSGERRYHVELITPQQPAPAVVHKIRWSCDCPYAAEHRRGTCKHVVAVALVTAERLAHDESTLRRWLGQPSSNAAEAEPAELDALATRMLAAFTAEPVSVDAAVRRALEIAPPPFDVAQPAR
jgi:hypothetical protein